MDELDKLFDELSDAAPDGFFGFGVGEEGLVGLLEQGELERAREKLRRKGTLDRREAAACLHAALNCPDEVFGEVLAACGPGEEYTAQKELPLPEGMPWKTADLFGTLPTVCAAMGETEKLRLLLDRGMDGAAASYAAFAAVQTASHRVPDYSFDCFSEFSAMWQKRSRQRVFGGCAGAEAFLTEPAAVVGGEENCLVSGMTPLAAAVLFGQTACVRLLLSQPGVRGAESSAVGAAALLAARGTPAQRACARLALGLPEDADVAAALCGGTLLPAENVAAFGTPEDLRRRLRAPGATVGEARALLENSALWDGAGLHESRAKKLMAVYAARPALLAEPAARDRLLIAGLKDLFYPWTDPAGKLMKHAGLTPAVRTFGSEFLKLWRKAAGPERDVSAGLSEMGKHLTGPQLKEALEILGEGGALTAAAEAVLGYWPELDLYALLRKVRFYRCTDVGISALATDILQTGSLRLLRFALRENVLAGEDRTALLRYAGAFPSSTPLRAAILTLPPRDRATRPLREGVNRQYWSGVEGEEAAALRRERDALLTAPAGDGRRREMLERFRDDSALMRPFFETPEYAAPDGRMLLRSFPAAVCCGSDDPALLRLVMALDDPRGTVGAGLFDDDSVFQAELDSVVGVRTVLSGTPLSLAAAAGRTALVRGLLDEGADPDEKDLPKRSLLNFYWQQEDLVVTPLALALWMEHPETAAALEAAGADRALAERIRGRLPIRRDSEEETE